jgi:hypothetical protein
MNDAARRPTTVVYGHADGTLAADQQTLTVTGGSEVCGRTGELLATNRADAHATRIETT